MPLPFINLDIDERCNCGHPQSEHWSDGSCRSRACECCRFEGRTYPPYAELDPADVCDCGMCASYSR
jgi:hypothetical protein